MVKVSSMLAVVLLTVYRGGSCLELLDVTRTDLLSTISTQITTQPPPINTSSVTNITRIVGPIAPPVFSSLIIIGLSGLVAAVTFVLIILTVFLCTKPKNIPVPRVVYYTNRMLGRPLPPIPSNADDTATVSHVSQNSPRREEAYDSIDERQLTNFESRTNHMYDKPKLEGATNLYSEYPEYPAEFDGNNQSDTLPIKGSDVLGGDYVYMEAYDHIRNESPGVEGESLETMKDGNRGSVISGYDTFVTQNYDGDHTSIGRGHDNLGYLEPM